MRTMIRAMTIAVVAGMVGIWSAICHPAEVTVLKYGEQNTEDNMMTVTAREFARLVKNKSQGRILIEVYPGSQLGGEMAHIEAIKIGSLDFYRPNCLTLGDLGAKKMGLLALPYIFRDREHFWNVLTSPIGDELLRDVAESGTQMVAIGYVEEGQRNFFFREKSIATVAEMKGLKIRVPQSKVLVDTITAFGATAQPIPYQKLYEALEIGVVDGAENPPTAYYTNKFWEVAKYYTLDGHSYSPSLIAVSQLTWKKLSAVDRRILLDAAEEVQTFNRALAEHQDLLAFAALRENGVVITDVPDKTPFQRAVKSVHEQYGKAYRDILERIAQTP
jgi:tripartite ATP-independent transporter DctP family solute receptor